MKRTLTFLPALIGHGALVVFTVFLFTGPFHLVELPLDTAEALVFDAGLCFAFILQHSLMIRGPVKGWIMQRIPRHYFGALFTLAAAGVLFLVVVLWQESPLAIASAEGVYRWLLRGVFFLALAGQIWTSRSLPSWVDIFGVQALRQGPDRTPERPPILMVGAYRWVRHPAYFTTLLFMWSYPDLTADRLLLNVLLTAWVLVGTLLEERDLVAVYGEEYRAYQRKVPMLIPYRMPPRAST